jgi:hypothetical protein
MRGRKPFGSIGLDCLNGLEGALKWCREEDSKLPGGKWQSGYAVREGVDAGSIPRPASA